MTTDTRTDATSTPLEPASVVQLSSTAEPAYQVQRPRRYVSGFTLAILRPFMRYSATRDAYVLRLVGRRSGPVLRRDRRRKQVTYDGPERRGRTLAAA